MAPCAIPGKKVHAIREIQACDGEFQLAPVQIVCNTMLLQAHAVFAGLAFVFQGGKMRFQVIVSGFFLTQIVGCASIVNGQNQTVTVEARSDSGMVPGATCKLSNNKGAWYVSTPGSTTVQRSFEDLSVRCDKESLDPGLASAKSSTKAMAFGNILFGGPIGAGIDIATGAAYDYPAVITVYMGKTVIVTLPVTPPTTDVAGRPNNQGFTAPAAVVPVAVPASTPKN